MDIFTEERQKKIIEIINKKDRISVPELSKIFSVSEVTIRRDLNALSDKKEIIRTHGGAIKKSEPDHIIWGAGSRKILFHNKESRFDKLIETDVDIQKNIAEFAANFINDEENIILEATTINIYLAQAISNKLHLNIFTNSPAISNIMNRPDSNSTVYCSGGTLKKGTDCFIGPRTIDFFNGLHVDKAFISIGAVSPEKKLSMSSIEEAEIRRALMKSTSEIIALGVSSRFNEILLFEVGQINEINKIITDNYINKKILKEISDLGIKVYTV